MPHIPDIHAHATHDPELIAAYASGDATGNDLELASALVAGCAECSALHHDLRAIAAALPAMPAPVRPRDFRLTPEQAASLRPTGWRRLAGALAGPRFAFAAPLGTGLATLGLAALLLSGSGLSLGLGGAATGERAATAADNAAGAAAPAEEAASPVASQVPQFDLMAGGSPAPASTDGKGSAVEPEPAATAVPVAAPTAAPVPAAATEAPGGGSGLSPVVLIAVLALLAGVLLLAGRILARRLVRAP